MDNTELERWAERIWYADEFSYYRAVPLMKEFTRQVRAAAWDEGAIARGEDLDYYPTNPYRSSE